jgi:hypothetical protein
MVLPVLFLTAAAPKVSTPDGPAVTEEMSCTFAIRAKNNMSFDVWVDLYNSTLNNGGFGLLGGHKPLKIQTHRLGRGKSMDRRYTASGSCGKERSWRFYVHIGRADGKKIYKYVNRKTKGDGDRTINLGNSSTWGL